jgi:NAD(P)-dependent dehydrogenase (short-subunit alcohol dehydrogenase family)
VIAVLRRSLRRIRRRRHPRLECRHRLLRADRDTDARCGTRTGHPGDRLLPRVARSLPPVPKAEARRQHRLRRQQERPRRLAGASAYCTAKAAEIHLARCLALEGAEHGIRVNTVNPDAVLRGSKIWDGEWKEQRAASNKIDSSTSSRSIYRKRSAC